MIADCGKGIPASSPVGRLYRPADVDHNLMNHEQPSDVVFN